MVALSRSTASMSHAQSIEKLSATAKILRTHQMSLQTTDLRIEAPEWRLVTILRL